MKQKEMLSRIEVLGKFGLFLLVSQIYFWIVGYLPNQEGEWGKSETDRRWIYDLELLVGVRPIPQSNWPVVLAGT